MANTTHQVQVNKLAQKLYDLLNKNVNLSNLTSEELNALSTSIEVIIAFSDALNEKGASELISPVLSSFNELVSQKSTGNIVYVRTSVELSNEQINKLKSKLINLFGSDITLKQMIDDKITGGLIIQHKDKIIDLSIDKQLEELKQQLKR